MTYGFVYVLGNESMPKIYKIGFTTKHPKERMFELSRATACPTPFELLAYFGSNDPAWVEQSIHKDLSCFRVNHAREFFKTDLSVIQNTFRCYVDPALDAFFSAPMDNEVALQEFDRDAECKRHIFFSQSADPIYWPKKVGFKG